MRDVARLSLRRLVEALAFIVRMRISERRFRWHQRRQARHTEQALGHIAAMAAEMERRADLCARYRGRPGPPVPRSGSGVPLVPRLSRQVTGIGPGVSVAVPSEGCAAPCPEGAEAGGFVGKRSDPHLRRALDPSPHPSR